MNEWPIVWLVCLKMLIIFLFAVVYIIGGRGPKWMRRWIGGTILAVGLNVIALIIHKWNLILGLSSFAIYGALTLGYGGDTFCIKVRRRLYYSLAFCGYTLLIGFITHRFAMAGFQCVITIATNLYLGLTNPTPSAVDEESIIAINSISLIPFMVG